MCTDGCASEITCGSRAGSLYHEVRDAAQYARMGVDYVKWDDCGEMNLASYAKFSVMRDAIAKTGRPMIYSFEPYTSNQVWLGTVGNSWRTGPDATPHYSSIIGNAFVNNLGASLAGPGHFNDADSEKSRPTSYFSSSSSSSSSSSTCLYVPLMLACVQC